MAITVAEFYIGNINVKLFYGHIIQVHERAYSFLVNATT